MTTLSETNPVALAYDSLNSTLAETGWRRSWVKDEQGQEKLVYFALTEADFLHPQEDDHLPSNTFHGTAQRDLIDILQRRYAQREDVGVFGDLIIKWGREKLRQHCPDVCVVFGLKDKEKYRSEFVVPEEGTKPAVVMEVVSPRYRRADRETKVKQYAKEGVQEYIILDRRRQRGERVDEVLGYRLEEGSYVPISPDEEGRIFSETLDIWVGMCEGKVMLFEGATGEPLLTSQALEQLAQQEHQLAQQERQRAEIAQQRSQELEALLNRYREQFGELPD
jgi:Uma2 family endonuclease